MGPCGQARAADITDHIALLHRLANGDAGTEAAQMAVYRGKARIFVPDLDEIAQSPALIALLDHDPVGGCDYRCTLGRDKIDAVMRPHDFQYGMTPAAAKVGADPPVIERRFEKGLLERLALEIVIAPVLPRLKIDRRAHILARSVLPGEDPAIADEFTETVRPGGIEGVIGLEDHAEFIPHPRIDKEINIPLKQIAESHDQLVALPHRLHRIIQGGADLAREGQPPPDERHLHQLRLQNPHRVAHHPHRLVGIRIILESVHYSR